MKTRNGERIIQFGVFLYKKKISQMGIWKSILVLLLMGTYK